MKIALAVVYVHCRSVTREMGLNDVKISIRKKIAHAQTHPGLDHSVVAERDASLQCLLGKRAVVVVVK